MTGRKPVAQDAEWRIATDIGGTFTDVIAIGPAGSLLRLKVLSTPSDYSLAITKALQQGLAAEMLAATVAFIHGTTVATNAILEGTTDAIALITTTGFRDVLEIRRSRRPNLYELNWQPPPSLVPRHLRLEVTERVGPDGGELIPLDEADVDRCVAVLETQPVRAVAVSLIHAYANPAHERLVAARLRAALPNVAITASSDVAPEPKEFERTSTTVINALLLPVVDDYLATLERTLSEIGVTSPIHVMQSDGTTVTSDLTRRHPFTIIESGPAAGVVAAARLAEELDRRSVIAFDMGGTTAKASLIENFRPSFADELEVGDSLNRAGSASRGSGYPVRSPCVDLSEVGAGGGSIAWVDGGGGLRVGPASAGSEPGPACYGNGGTEPTTTDAHVVLGYLNPESIAGGSKRIYADLAHEAVGRLAERMGMSVHDAAYGIYSVANANMRRAVRTVSVERGRDPRDFSLFAFGGAGGLHAAALAGEIEMREVVVPIVPGLFSSLGLLFSDLAVTRVAAHRAPLDAPSLVAAADVAAELARAASDELRSAYQGAGDPELRYSISLRYVGQSSTLNLPLGLGAGGLPEELAIRLTASFHEEHRRVRGQAAVGEPIEMVNLRATATWKTNNLTFTEIAEDERRQAPGSVEKSVRDLYFGPTIGWRSSDIIARVHVDSRPTPGPLVVEEPEATIVVPPDWSCVRHETGSLLLVNDAPDPA